MIFLCDCDGTVLDADKDQTYTVINNFTLKRQVLCQKCYNELFKHRKEINHLLREVTERHYKNLPGDGL